ncbi:MAG: (2Fe-2S) ferredoxin domain-containing protein [Treponema sp.]|jgi:NADH:ubiquinone oxidoreductase subunit E|nr:(2Fe-2S) ferredoxin domain-containing protein [Treponema sp.]
MVEVCVCIGSSCHIKGSYNVIQAFQQLIEEKALHDRISFKSGFCMKQCQHAGVAVSVDGVTHQVSAEKADGFFMTEILPKLSGLS